MLSNANDDIRDIDSNRAVGGETLEAVDTTERNWLKVIRRRRRVILAPRAAPPQAAGSQKCPKFLLALN